MKIPKSYLFAYPMVIIGTCGGVFGFYTDNLLEGARIILLSVALLGLGFGCFRHAVGKMKEQRVPVPVEE